ncbi:MAG: MBL fold metallo-hydrolase [Ruminiclostridium sp.]|nr:MBL fold metallo-hydrolase [Ruminiclostridium sp.]
MNVTFVYHSCFLVELEHCSLLFDWYGGVLPELDRTKPLYVLNSHHHGDHYSPEIFSLGVENTWYILGNCIRLSAKRKAAMRIDDEHVLRLGGGKELTLGDLRITTLHSTDAGVAFLIETEGKTIYHAGDLHWWHWEGEPAQWNRDMERDFKREIGKLEGRTIDLAFLVLDPRQEGDYWLGFDWTMRHTDIRAAFPMHSWEEFWVTKKLVSNPRSEGYRDRIHAIHYNGQQFTLPERKEHL